MSTTEATTLPTVWLVAFAYKWPFEQGQQDRHFDSESEARLFIESIRDRLLFWYLGENGRVIDAWDPDSRFA
ncbi:MULTISPECIES: hypothetical protein [Stutzerimonas]|uniref:Uncharacterized protein n=1 Tax=Stutzerimonas zhaodongensis TaxID=1176257 RepID=A0ABX8J0F9_9GAMM|nr:hypothetical protein [Stutzerimonas zhaodongensis]QWV19447.1 hypothetical protein KQ248_22720 [Stutzerimonas zhaodongensis]